MRSEKEWKGKRERKKNAFRTRTETMRKRERITEPSREHRIEQLAQEKLFAFPGTFHIVKCSNKKIHLLLDTIEGSNAYAYMCLTKRFLTFANLQLSYKM